MTLPTNLAALVTLWQTIPSGMTTVDKLKYVNAQQVAGPAVDVPRAALRNLLDGSTAAVRAYAIAGANLEAKIACNYLLTLIGEEDTPTIPTSNPAALALVQQIAPNLLLDAATGITQDEVDRMMALITPLVPWWQMNGFTAPVNVIDLVNAGYLY